MREAKTVDGCLPVFTLCSNAQLFNLSLDGGQSFGSGGVEDELEKGGAKLVHRRERCMDMDLPGPWRARSSSSKVRADNEE